MKKHLITLGFVLSLLSANTGNATETTTDTTSPSTQVDTVRIWSTPITGYVLFDPAVNAGEEHTLRFATLKTTGVINRHTNWQVQFDFASLTLVAAQAEYKHDLFGGTFQSFVGRVFTAGGQITPAPNNLYAPNWSSVYLPFTFIGDGIGTQFTYKGFDAFLVSTNRISAAATYKGLEALWEDSIGTEVGYTPTYAVGFLHPSLKTLFFADNGKSQYAASNWLNLGHGLRCYQLAKWGRTEGLSVGLTLDVPNVRVKAFYDLKAETAFSELVFTF